MKNISELYSLMPVWVTLTFIECDRVTRKNLSPCSVVQWHDVVKTFCLIDYVREMIVNKFCKYSRYGMLEHVLFVWVGLFC